MGQNSSKAISAKKMQSYLADKNFIFSEIEIQKLLPIYKQHFCGGKNMKLSEFKSIYGDMFSGDSDAFAEHMFRAFDLDGNGDIDFGEFLTGIVMLSKLGIQRKLHWIFNAYDIDGDGIISQKELENVLKSVIQMTALNDTQSDKAESPEITAKNMIDRLDTNRDRKISREEFCNGAINDGKIYQLLMNINP